jgi:dsRNA-gated channel SID-1
MKYYLNFFFLQKDKFPLGFFLVMVVHGDDAACLSSTPLQSQTRHKIVNFSLRKKISYEEYLVATFGAFGVFAIFYAVSFIVAILHQMRYVLSRSLKKQFFMCYKSFASRRRQRAASEGHECLITGEEPETDSDPRSRDERLKRKVE